MEDLGPESFGDPEAYFSAQTHIAEAGLVVAGAERRLERIAERAEAVRSAAAKLSEEERREGRRLLARSDALSNAYAAVLQEETPEKAKAQTLEVLRELREEANAEYGRYRERMGIPGPSGAGAEQLQ
jgi:hypothetical protein